MKRASLLAEIVQACVVLPPRRRSDGAREYPQPIFQWEREALMDIDSADQQSTRWLVQFTVG
jgi:hypothetical protein